MTDVNQMTGEKSYKLKIIAEVNIVVAKLNAIAQAYLHRLISFFIFIIIILIIISILFIMIPFCHVSFFSEMGR